MKCCISCCTTGYVSNPKPNTLFQRPSDEHNPSMDKENQYTIFSLLRLQIVLSFCLWKLQVILISKWAQPPHQSKQLNFYGRSKLATMCAKWPKIDRNVLICIGNVGFQKFHSSYFLLDFFANGHETSSQECKENLFFRFLIFSILWAFLPHFKIKKIAIFGQRAKRY